MKKHTKTWKMTERGDWWEVELRDENGISAGFYEKSLFQAFESAYLWFMSSKERKKKEDLLAKSNERYEIAKTDMTREQHIKLLEIIRENGVSLREGAMGVKTYYEIAKAAYLEGLSNGLKI